MNILDNILAHKRNEVAALKRIVSRAELKKREMFSYRRLSLVRALQRARPAIIAEIKKASPSKGVIREHFDARAIARDYVRNDATALSVVTDRKFFQGDIQFIEQVRTFVPIPILRKDFIIDSYQLYESKAFGADAVLLIAAALEVSQLHDLVAEASEIDLECLVEAHTEEEIERLDFAKIRIVGINNRNLGTFETDISTSKNLRRHVPSSCVVVSESGISSSDDIRQLMAADIDAFLIGENFMRAQNPGKALDALLKESAL